MLRLHQPKIKRLRSPWRLASQALMER